MSAHKTYKGFSLAEMLVAMAILSMLILATTNVLVQVSKIKTEAEIRAEISDSLQHSVETIKAHLLECSADDIAEHCTGESCNLGADRPRFYLDTDKGQLIMERPAEGEGGGVTIEHLTSSEIEVTDVSFNQVDNYVFMLFTAQDPGGKLITEEEKVVVQGSIVIRNE